MLAALLFVPGRRARTVTPSLPARGTPAQPGRRGEGWWTPGENGGCQGTLSWWRRLQGDGVSALQRAEGGGPAEEGGSVSFIRKEAGLASPRAGRGRFWPSPGQHA